MLLAGRICTKDTGPSGTHHTDTAKTHLSLIGSVIDSDGHNFNTSQSGEEEEEVEAGVDEAASE